MDKFNGIIDEKLEIIIKETQGIISINYLNQHPPVSSPS